MISIPVFSRRDLKSWPRHEKGGRVLYIDLAEALNAEYRTDAHFAAYHCPKIERRLCYEALSKPEVEVYMVLAVFDVDAHDELDIDGWWIVFELPKIDELLKQHPEFFIYRTRGGYRLVALIEPIRLLSVEHAKQTWTPLYNSWVRYLARVFGIHADETDDWTREYRLPRATRDETHGPESLEFIGSPDDIGYFRPELLPEDQAPVVSSHVASKVRPPIRRANNAGNGLLYAMLSVDGRVHEPISDGCWRITCPKAHEHSSNSDGTAATVLWRPRPGEEFGSINCKHSGSGHDRYTLRDWIRCFPQSAIDAARSALQITYDDPNRFSLSDLGNAERMHRDHSDRVVWCPQRKRWYVWDGCIWAPDESLEIVGLAKQTIRSIAKEIDQADIEARKDIVKHWQKSEQVTRLNAMLELARAEPGIAVSVRELDADPNLLCCANGVLDLTTYRLIEFKREQRITRQATASFRPSNSELWLEFVDFVTGGDRDFARYLQRVAGYCLSGTATEKAFFFLYGPPDGAKSTFVRAIGHALGSYYSPSSSDTWVRQTATGGNRGDLVRLQGSRMTFASEIKPSSHFDEALVKRVTGGDPIVAAAKYEAEVEFVATFKLILAANTPPRIYDDDEGMWSRVQRIPFTNVIAASARDPRFSERLSTPDALAAILGWCVEGHRMWRAEGLGTCAAVRRSNESYRREMDRWQGFVDDELTFCRDVAVHTQVLHDAYLRWCKMQGVTSPLRERDYGDRLLAAGATRQRTATYRYWSGVTLSQQMRSAAEIRGFQAKSGSEFD